jgi:wobble nucleotide-excising tRNase
MSKKDKNAMIVKDGELVRVDSIPPENQDTLFDNSAKLADQEKSDVEKRAEVLAGVIKVIDDVLVKENVTIKEFGDMLDIFNGRNNLIMNKITIKEVKEKFNE